MKEFKFNLQMFANHVNVTTDTRDGAYNPASTGGANTLSSEMKTFYDMTLIDEASASLVHDQFGQKRPIPANGGKAIEFRRFFPLPKALTPLTEGVTPDGKRLDVTAITATVNQYGDYITQSDVLELTALDNTILEATKLLGRQAGATLDTITRDILVAGTNVSYAPKWVSTTETAVTSRGGLNNTAQLNVKTVQKVVAKLRAQNAPTINGDYVAIIHPYAAYALMRDPEWVDAHKYAQPDNLYTGEIGKVAGVRFVTSTEAKIIREPDLASNSRTLAVNHDGGYSGAITSVAFDGGTVVADALIGRKIVINGISVEVTDNTNNSITFASTNFGTIADNAVIAPEGAADGSSVYCTLFLGEGAYGVTEITGGGLQTIVKQKGSAGTGDPLDQRSSVGWKAMKTAERLIESYIVRVESCVTDFADTAAN